MLAKTSKLRLTVALSVVAVLSSTAVAAARPAPIGHASPNPATVVARIHHDLPVGAGATGDGPANNADCQGFADTINGILDTAQKVLTNIGNTPLYDEGIDLARSIENDAENAGCFIINPV